MTLTPYAQQLQHFDQHRELCGVERQPISTQDAESTESFADYYVRRTLSDDNDARDYDPLPNRILKWSGGTTTAATYDVQKTERHLERTDLVYGKRRYVVRVHQTLDALEVWHSFSYPGSSHLVECWRVDYREPEQSFYQETWLPADPRGAA